MAEDSDILEELNELKNKIYREIQGFLELAAMNVQSDKLEFVENGPICKLYIAMQDFCEHLVDIWHELNNVCEDCEKDRETCGLCEKFLKVRKLLWQRLL